MQAKLEWFLRGAAPSKGARPPSDILPMHLPTREAEEAAMKALQEKQNAKALIESNEAILKEYAQLKRKPLYVGKVLISPSLVDSVRSQK